MSNHVECNHCGQEIHFEHSRPETSDENKQRMFRIVEACEEYFNKLEEIARGEGSWINTI